jgi:hypothetical protein
VVKCVFLLQQDNVICCQALLDLWGEVPMTHTQYTCTVLTVPLDTLTVTYGGTYNVQPLSNAYKNWITQFQDMYDHCNCQTAWSDHNIFDLTSSHFDSYCKSLTYNHEWSPPVTLYATALMLLHVIISLWSHPSIPMMGSKKSAAFNSPEHLSQEPHYIHDETIDAFPGTGLNNILLEDNVSIVPNTKELFEE